MTSTNGNFFRVIGPLCGEFTGPGEFPAQRPVTRSFHVLFDLRLNKRLSKQPWGWWFETPSWSLWLQCNIQENFKKSIIAYIIIIIIIITIIIVVVAVIVIIIGCIIIVARLSKSLATLTLGSSKINQHYWRFHGSGVIAAPQIMGLISFCTGMHHGYFFEVVNVLSCFPFMFENTINKQLIDG